MESARNVSQKESNKHYEKSHPEEILLDTILETMKRGVTITPEHWKFLYKELNLNLHTAYGIYLAMCKEENIIKTITWRTFYMQCNGYRTLKPNTEKALVKYINMEFDARVAMAKKHNNK